MKRRICRRANQRKFIIENTLQPIISPFSPDSALITSPNYIPFYTPRDVVQRSVFVQMSRSLGLMLFILYLARVVETSTGCILQFQSPPPECGWPRTGHPSNSQVTRLQFAPGFFPTAINFNCKTQRKHINQIKIDEPWPGPRRRQRGQQIRASPSSWIRETGTPRGVGATVLPRRWWRVVAHHTS